MTSTSDALLTIDEYKQSLLTSIYIGITATNNDDAYSVGLRNGLRICKAYIDGQKPDYEEVQNDPLTWEELMRPSMIGEPVWSEWKRRWFLVADSALDNRSWVDLVDSSGKITRLGPHDLKQIRLYKREKK